MTDALRDLDEARRLAIIGRHAEVARTRFLVADEATAERYVTRLLADYRVRVTHRGRTPDGLLEVVVEPASRDREPA